MPKLTLLPKAGLLVLTLFFTVSTPLQAAATPSDAYGVGFGAEELEPQTPRALELASQALIDWVRLGLDTRIMYYASHRNGVKGLDQSTFFPMEGQLRVAIEPYDNLKIIGTQGIVVDSPGFPDSYVARELYGLFQGLPCNGFVQAGRGSGVGLYWPPFCTAPRAVCPCFKTGCQDWRASACAG